LVRDNRSYNENITLNSTTSPWLECQGHVNITGTSGIGVFLKNVDGPVMVGCHIEGFSRGIYTNSSQGLIKDNILVDNNQGIFLEGDADVNKLLNNTILIYTIINNFYKFHK